MVSELLLLLSFYQRGFKESVEEGLKDNHVEGGSGGLPFRKNWKESISINSPHQSQGSGLAGYRNGRSLSKPPLGDPTVSSQGWELGCLLPWLPGFFYLEDSFQDCSAGRQYRLHQLLENCHFGLLPSSHLGTS